MAAFVHIGMLLCVLAPLASFAWISWGSLWSPQRGPCVRSDTSRAFGEPIAGYVATAAIGASLVLACLVLVVWVSAGVEARVECARAASASALVWLSVGGTAIEVGLRLDSLAVAMVLVVALCATCVHVYSLAYMRGEPGFARYFALLSLFCAAMLGLVLASNLLLVFVFWELVGVCSALLIGFWHERRSARHAAVQAFVVNRVGDAGFVVAMGICLTCLDTLSLDAAIQAFTTTARDGTSTPSPHLFADRVLGVSLATWMGIGLLLGAMGKSAQVPLHVWLPDAMEGPTPISALIHAATMVAAGVYLVARVFPLLTTEAQAVAAAVGCATLTLAALMALVQTDVKRILAYSTVSQLGYMMLGLGLGAWTGALFHLITHAFFKALLFLGAGQVIVATGESDVRRMGGLAAKLPRTTVTFLIAALALAGVGVPWTPLGVGGFYGKDEILSVAWMGWMGAAGSWPSAWLFVLPWLGAFLTALYIGRCFVLMFLGSPRGDGAAQAGRESRDLTAPMLVLAALTLTSGWFLFRTLVEQSAPQRPPRAVLVDSWAGTEAAPGHGWLPLLTTVAWVGGFLLAYRLYRDGVTTAQRIRSRSLVGALAAAADRRFYFDVVYRAVFVGGVRALAAGCRFVDNRIIDALVDRLARLVERLGRFTGLIVDDRGVDGAAGTLAWGVRAVGGLLSRVQTGLIRQYVLVAAAGVAGALLCIVTGGAGLDWALLLVLASLAAIVAPWPARRQTE